MTYKTISDYLEDIQQDAEVHVAIHLYAGGVAQRTVWEVWLNDDLGNPYKLLASGFATEEDAVRFLNVIPTQYEVMTEIDPYCLLSDMAWERSEELRESVQAAQVAALRILIREQLKPAVIVSVQNPSTGVVTRAVADATLSDLVADLGFPSQTIA
jgi:hypothetical protein